MFYWKFSDGTTVYSRARVEGGGPFAVHLRRELVSLTHGCGPLVWQTPETPPTELDPASDDSLSRWLEQEARACGLRLAETDFAPLALAKARPDRSRRDPVASR
ncbi:MAG: hypothetical protein SFU83_11235 [Meiothermus sp.]|nr:hypothetical protein [Meiothermus sp.]